MALGVSKVRGSADMGAWRVWGCGGLLERKCKEKGRTKSANGRLWEHFGSFLGPFWETRAETESTGPKRAFRRLSDAPRATKSANNLFCFRYLGGPHREVDGKRLAEPMAVSWDDPKD